MNTTLTIKVPKKLRDEAKRTAAELGVPLTTAMNAMLKQFVREKELVLSAKVPNLETRRAMKEVREGKGLTSMTFEEFSTYLRSL